MTTSSVPQTFRTTGCSGRRALVHHGGAGTTYAALAAGVPQLAVSPVADQPYWERRIHEEGLGPVPILLIRLTSETVTAALRALIEARGVNERAALGERSRGEQALRGSGAVIRHDDDDSMHAEILLDRKSP